MPEEARSLHWVCTECGTAAFRQYPFEDLTIGGLGLRTCAVCGDVHDCQDGMHLVGLPVGVRLRDGSLT